MRNAVACALWLLGVVVSPASAQQVPAGGDIAVDPGRAPSVAADSAGNFVVVWEAAGVQPFFDLDIFARRYDASGTPRGARFRVNTETYRMQVWGKAASDAAGRFVVVWSSYIPDAPLGARGQHENSGGFFGVAGQRYDSSGVPQGGEFRVNSFVGWGRSSLACAARGSCFVAWESSFNDGRVLEVYGRPYDPSGAPRGPEFPVNTYTFDQQRAPSVAADAAGNVVVVWESAAGQDGSATGVFGQRFDAVGTRRGSEFRVNTYTGGAQGAPSVASDAAGNFVVVWHSPHDGSGTGVFGQRYDASGAPRGAEFRVNSHTTASQYVPAVASAAAGDFIVTWESNGQDGSGAGVFAQRYDAAGLPRGSEFRINAATAGWQRGPSVTSDTVGNHVITWTTDQSGVFARRFGGIVPSALAVDTVAAGSNGNRVLEPGESVDVRPSWRNVNGAAQTFNGNALGFGGPPANGVSYQLVDGAGAYGAVPNGAAVACTDCYRVAVPYGGTRPASHWDATFTERLTPDTLGQTMPWSLHVGGSFSDVPRTSPYYRFAETLLHRGVTAGCMSGVYCAGAATTREQLAAFVLLAREGGTYVPPRCATPNTFADVPETSPFCDVIEELTRRGVVGGCGGGNYCPTGAVTRDQMAVFVLRTLDPTSSPPPCGAPMFADVPASNPYCLWIEELARRGVVSGCGGGNYCPLAPVTREQMAVFLTVTFGLTLYGP